MVRSSDPNALAAGVQPIGRVLDDLSRHAFFANGGTLPHRPVLNKANEGHTRPRAAPFSAG